MGHCYSLDLRVRVADFVEAGHSCRAGAPAPPARPRGRPPPGGGKLVPYESFLIQTVEAEPAITMPELAARLLEEHGIVAAPAMLSRFLCRRGFTYKKTADGGGVRTRRRAG